MTSNTFETLGTIRPDGTLELDRQLTAPPGRVKVRVEPVSPSEGPKEGLMEFVERTRREMEAAGSRIHE